MKYYFHNLSSCYQRAQNVMKYQEFLRRNGGEYCKPSEAEVIYIWTCSFRQDAKDNSVERIREIHAAYPAAELVICGCMTTIAPKTTQALACETGAKVIPWKNEEMYFDKSSLIDCDLVYGARPVAKDLTQYRKENPNKPIAFADQFIKLCISEGCTCNCEYCSEKLAFPPYKSFPIKDLVNCCKQMLSETDCRRVILVADSPGEYGRDTGTDITKLMDALYALDDQLELVLSNFHPKFFARYYDYFDAKLATGRIYHINLPIQSASTKVLKAMNRGYTEKDLERIFSGFSRIGFNHFDTHILVGFDGETREDFEETVKFLERWRPRYLLISKYMCAKSEYSGELRTNEVDEKEKVCRVLELAERAHAYGAIVNYEGSELGQDRWKRLNQI